jgi:serine/threonine protein kinase
VAVKLLNDKYSQDATSLTRFVREAKAASGLNHPNILTIYEFGAAVDGHFIVSEYVAGQTLREVLSQETMSLVQVMDIAIQLTGALAAAHEAHIIHRDIKPENVMLRPDGYVKILDFGLAKLVGPKHQSFPGLADSAATESQTARGVILGTVNYMSPEQAKGEQVDERTDIFSLGAVLYEMLAGRTPFAGASPSETFANLINAEPQPLSGLAANAPEQMRRIVAKMLRKNREERYQTMKGVLADLKDLKERQKLEERLERGPPFESENATAILQATTGDANQPTAATQNSLAQRLKQHKPFAAFVLTALLIIPATLGYYFFRAGKTAAGGGRKFAVLPIKPINSANRDEIYEMGIAESLINKLGTLKGFIVRPLSATRKYADVGQDPLAAGKEQLVDYVLASNYQLAGGKIRLTAQHAGRHRGRSRK